MCKKLITCWGVMLNDKPQNLLTITATKKEAFEYAENFLRLIHLSDYKTWCYFNHIEDISNQNNWRLYVQKRLDPEDLLKYSVVKCKFNSQGISLALRVLNNCMPIGSSFDHPIEYENLKNLASISEDINMVVEGIKESIGINPNINIKNVKVLEEENAKQ